MKHIQRLQKVINLIFELDAHRPIPPPPTCTSQSPLNRKHNSEKKKDVISLNKNVRRILVSFYSHMELLEI